MIDKNKSEEKIFDPFINKPEGIFLISDLIETKHRIINENFFIELLEKDIKLEKEIQNCEMLEVTIDKRDTRYGIISNKGKRALIEYIIASKNRDRYSENLVLDFQISKFMNTIHSKNISKVIKLNENKLMLRWASGGIISIVDYRDKRWIPMFYRDIKPAGWNVALGASERLFDKDKSVLELSDGSHNERLCLDALMTREFDEEFLVLSSEPKEGEKVESVKINYKGKAGNAKFNEDHIKLRQKFDKINFEQSENAFDRSVIETQRVPTRTKLKVLHEDGEVKVSDVLVAINIADLGIEVVEVIKFKLDRQNIILDGEILEAYDEKKGDVNQELVRMPVALISLDYLRKYFSKEDKEFNYMDSSIVLDDKDCEILLEENMILFDYDLKKRRAFIEINHDKFEDVQVVKECERYKNSMKYFKLEKEGVGIKEEAALLFTPASAKLLTQLFNRVDDEYLK